MKADVKSTANQLLPWKPGGRAATQLNDDIPYNADVFQVHELVLGMVVCVVAKRSEAHNRNPGS
jgi:hypothetical protein